MGVAGYMVIQGCSHRLPMLYWISSINRVYIVPLEIAKVEKIVSLVDKLPSWYFCLLVLSWVQMQNWSLGLRKNEVENLADTPIPFVNAKCELTVG